MTLINQGGKLLLRDGALGTGQGCCCGGPCNPQTCPNGTECTPPCVCVDGQCAPVAGACCLPDGTCTEQYTTQEDCEACGTSNTCYEYLFLDDPEQSCPDGWTPDGFGGCSRVTNPESCESCDGFCYSQQTGPCGDFYAGVTCENSPCAPGCQTFTFAGPGGCVTPECAEDWTAALEAAGYINIQVEWGTVSNACGQVFGTTITATCCECVAHYDPEDGECPDCEFSLVNIRCQGPCWEVANGIDSSPAATGIGNCPSGTVEVFFANCCPNPLP